MSAATAKPAHTPGAWTVLRADWDEAGNARYTLDGIKTVGTADARLIAAAPYLLQELTHIAHADVSEWAYPSEFRAWAQGKAKAAIEKVLGGPA